MKKKLMYEVPDAELIELKLDSNQMDLGSPGSIKDEGYNDLNEGNDY